MHVFMHPLQQIQSSCTYVPSWSQEWNRGSWGRRLIRRACAASRATCRRCPRSRARPAARWDCWPARRPARRATAAQRRASSARRALTSSWRVQGGDRCHRPRAATIAPSGSWAGCLQANTRSITDPWRTPVQTVQIDVNSLKSSWAYGCWPCTQGSLSLYMIFLIGLILWKYTVWKLKWTIDEITISMTQVSLEIYATCARARVCFLFKW